MNKEKQFLVNITASLITFFISFGINFFFTPYITENVGGEAYGFVGLANNMVNYVTIITVALNSVAGRFITVTYHQNKKKEANQYFTSVLVANIGMAVLLSLAVLPIIFHLEKVIQISPELVTSVKQLFFFIYLNFILTLVGTVFTTATFITNKLYLSSLANIVTALSKVFLLLLLYGILDTNVAYIGVATCISTLAGLILNVIYTRRLVPDIRMKKEDVSFAKVRELFSSGIWSSITKLSQVLSDGLDLLITNLWISPYFMGQLSIAQTIPTYLSSLVSTVTSLFNPNLTLYYAKNQTDELVKELKTSMKLSAFFSNIIFVVVLVFGDYFFQLWVPEQNVELIYPLAIIVMMSVAVSGVTTSLNNVFLVTNKLKVNSLFWLIVSGLNLVIVFILLNMTSLGVYAVAGVSKLTGVIANLTYLPIYASNCLKVKKTTFYPLIVRYLGTTGIMVIVFSIIRKCYILDITWMTFLVLCIISGLAGCIINYFLFLEQPERSYLWKRLLRRKTAQSE